MQCSLPPNLCFTDGLFVVLIQFLCLGETLLLGAFFLDVEVILDDWAGIGLMSLESGDGACRQLTGRSALLNSGKNVVSA